MEEISIRKYQQAPGKTFPIYWDWTAGFPLLPPFSPTPAKKKKKSCFIFQRLAHHPPLPAQLGGPGWSVALHARYKLYSGHCANPLHLFHSLLCSTNRRNKTSNSRMLHWEQAHSILSPLSCCSHYFNLSILQGTHQQQDSRPDLISKAMNVPPRAGKELIRVQGKLTGQCGRGAGALKQWSFKKRNSGHWYLGWILNVTLTVIVLQQPTWWHTCLKWVRATLGKSS